MHAENLQCLCVMCGPKSHVLNISYMSVTKCWIVAFLVLMLSLDAESFEDGGVVRVISGVFLSVTTSTFCSSLLFSVTCL